MDKPLVSILTVTRNRGNLLKRCISSVLSQTYKNIEHIVIDGASDDTTDEVVACFHDNRLKFIKLDYNWPLKETKEYGYSLCKGKYITFLDSDDEYLPTKIEKQVDLFEKLPLDYGMVYCWMSYFDSSKDNKYMYIHNPQLRGFVADEVVEKPVISGTPTFMFRKEVLVDDLHGWNYNIGIVSDWELGVRCCQKYKVDYIPESLVNVYINHGYVRITKAGEYYKDASERIIKFHKYFLSTYADVFQNNPQKAWYHYECLMTSYIRQRNYKEALYYYKKLMKVKPCLNYLVYPFKLYLNTRLKWK